LEGIHIKGHTSIMDSKRSSLDGTITLWKEFISRDTIGVKILDSNRPIEEITMSTFISKYKQYEDAMRGLVSSVVESVGCVTT
jgi:hypothetical protein